MRLVCDAWGGVTGLSPKQIDTQYRRVHVDLLHRIEDLLNVYARLHRCAECGETAFWRVSVGGSNPYSVFYCTAHRPTTAVEFNPRMREALETLRGI